MAIQGNRIIAINEQTGERKEYPSVYALSKAMNVSPRAAQQAQERNGLCRGWRIYDNPGRIRERIASLEQQLKIVEG